MTVGKKAERKELLDSLLADYRKPVRFSAGRKPTQITHPA